MQIMYIDDKNRCHCKQDVVFEQRCGASMEHKLCGFCIMHWQFNHVWWQQCTYHDFSPRSNQLNEWDVHLWLMHGESNWDYLLQNSSTLCTYATIAKYLGSIDAQCCLLYTFRKCCSLRVLSRRKHQLLNQLLIQRHSQHLLVASRTLMRQWLRYYCHIPTFACIQKAKYSFW